MLKKFIIFGLVALGLFFVVQSTTAQNFSLYAAQTSNSSPFKILPDKCNTAAEAAQGPKGGCDFYALLELIVNIIKLLMYAGFIIAPILIIAGGLMILTAGGSGERVSQGTTMIKATVIGLIIIICSWLIVKLVFIVLGAGATLDKINSGAIIK